MPLSPINPTGGRRIARAFRAGLTALTSLLLVTCSENPTAPHHGAFGYLSVRPVFGNANALFAPLSVDNLRLTVIRPPSTVLKTVTQPFPSNTDTVRVTAAQIPLDAASEDLEVTIELFAGNQLLFFGRQTVTVTAGAPAPPALVPMLYQGPGANMATLTLAPRDTTVTPGAVLDFRVTALDSTQGALTSFYVGWRASAGTITNAGQFTAPAVRDTVTIVVAAPAPNTTKDSTRVFVIPGPGSASISSGDAQSALAGAKLAQPLAVLVKGTDNLPLAGVTVAFAAVTGGGSVDSATAKTDASGIARSGVTLGATAGIQTFSATVAGIPAVIFTATATAPGGIIAWDGSASSDWNTAANWTPAFVPASTNDVTIPAGTPNQPLLTTTSTINNLTIASGATLSLNGGFTFNVTGNLDALGSLAIAGGAPTIQLSGAAKTLRGNLASASISGTIALAGSTSVLGNVAVSGGTASLNLGPNGLTVGGSFSTGSGGRLIQTGGGTMTVQGSVTFAGGDETGQLSNGTLNVGGDFTQSGAGSATSFAASGSHLTAFAGASTTHTVTFGTPGAGAGGSHFNTLDVSNTATVLLASDAFADLQLVSTPSGTPATVGTTGATHKFTAFGVNVTGLTMNQATVAIGNGSIAAFNAVHFTNSPTTVPQLSVNHSGLGGPFTFSSLSFATTPVAPNGFYLDVTDVDGGANGSLLINMAAPSPASGGGFVRATGGATVVWPLPATRTWAGTASTDWFNPLNWTPNGVPTTVDDVSIPVSTPVATLTATGCVARSLTVTGQMSLGSFNCQVGGNVLAGGVIAGTTGAIQIVAAGQISGNIPSLVINAPVAVAGATGMGAGNGNITISGAGASLTMNGQTLVTPGNLAVQNGGLLVMTNPADVLTIQANATFDGGDESASLTNGVLSVFGNFTQLATSSGGSFSPTGNFLTQLGGAASTVSFATPGGGAGQSRFRALTWSTGNAGTLTLGSNVFVLGGFTYAVPSGSTITGTNRLLATTAFVNANPGNALIFNNVRMQLTQSTGGPLALDNLTFQSMDPTVTQLGVSHTGAGGPFGFTNLKFLTAPTTGLYLVATDIDGAVTNGPFTVNMYGPSPATATGLFQGASGAVVNWPAGGGVIWNGLTDTSWTNPLNWTPNRVPTAIDTVTIPGSTPNLAHLGLADRNVASLSILSGGQLATDGVSLLSAGSVLADGPVTGAGAVEISGVGQVRGNLPRLVVRGGQVTVTGALLLASDLTVDVGGKFNLGANTTFVQGNFATVQGGTLTMTDPADLLDVFGKVTFSGGDETGLLTQGVLLVSGGFIQQGVFAQTGIKTFVAGGNHTVEFGTALTPTTPVLTLADPANSPFQNLAMVGSAHWNLTTNLTVLGQLSAAGGAASPDTLGAGTPGVKLSVGRTVVQGLVLDGVPLVVTSGPMLAFDNVTFRNQDPLGTQLTVNSNGAGSPYALNSVVFQTTPNGGFYISANDLDGPTGIALTLNLFGATPATPGQGTTQVNNGAVINWPGAAPIQWSSTAATTDWYTGTNWVGGVFPGPADSAVIVSGANQPVLTAPVLVGALNISGGNLTVGGQQLLIQRTLTTTGTGTLTMTNALDNVQVTGNAIFSGGATTGLLTAGQLQIGGSFQQHSTASNASFAADAGHTTVFTSQPAVLSFQTPGTTASHFGTLRHSNCCTSATLFTLASNVTVLGVLDGGDGFGGTVNGTCGSILTVQYVNSGGTFDCVQLVLDDPSGTNGSASGLHFTNQPSNVDQLTIIHPGLAGSAQYSVNATFTALAGGTGHYINAIDADGSATPNQLVVAANPNPGNGPSFTKTDGVAQVLWSGAGANIWLGTTSTDWNTTANWSAGRAPLLTDPVLIPASAVSDPAINAPATALSVQMDAGRTLTITNANLQVNGDFLIAPGATVTDVGSGGVTLTGAANTVSGAVGFISLPINSQYFLGGPTTSTNVQIAGGTLVLSGQPLLASGDFSTSSSGTVRLQNPTDQLVVTGNVTFAGGDETGLLTAGALVVGGNFVQDGTIARTSFAASGTFATIFNGAGAAQNVTFGTPGVTASSNFQDVQFANAGGAVVLQSNVAINGIASISNNVGVGSSLDPNGHTVRIAGILSVQNLGLLVMLNPLDSVVVGGDALFAGGSSSGEMSRGVLILGGSLTQLGTTSATSFAPSGTHKTVLGSGAARSVSFGTPGSGAAGSHFQTLDVTGASNGVTFLSSAFVDSALAVSVGAAPPKLLGSGNTLTAREWLVTGGLTVDHLQMVLNEGTSALTQTFSGVTFQNFPTSTSTETLITASLAGALSPRSVTFTGTGLQQTFGGGTGTYVRVSSSNALGVNLIMSGSSDPTGGASRSVATAPATIQYQ